MLFVISGPNGAGKTTFAESILTHELKGLRFLNADEIARGLSPFDPWSMRIKAGRILLEEMEAMVGKGESFALESTLTGKAHRRRFEQAKERGYKLVIRALLLPSAEVSAARVKLRVSKGGHDIPEKDLRRRFEKFWENLLETYLPIADNWEIYESTRIPPILKYSSSEISVEALKEGRSSSSRVRESVPDFSEIDLHEATEAAMKRAAEKVREEHRRLGLPILIWRDGKMIEEPA